MASSRAVRPSLAAILLPSSRPTSSSTAAVALLLPRKTQQIGNQVSRFSTSPTLLKRHTYAGARKTRDNNKHRGESTIRRTGPRWRLSVSDEPLPRPVAPKDLPQVETDPNHGLWDFFYDKTTTVNPPTQDSQHGRPWSVEELRHKSWDDLHKLWWVCVKERNRIATSSYEREKLSLGFGAAEAQKRDAMVRMTMRAIKHTLTERFYVWEDAVKLAEEDPEVDLSGNGNAYTPMEYLEEEEEGERDLHGSRGSEEQQLADQDKEKASEVDPSALPASQTPRDSARV